MIAASACVTSGAAYAPAYGGATVSVGFRAELSPYGEWFQISPYGLVWRPYESVVGGEFQPYLTGGRWEWTDYGWQFNSHYPFGWATFHYGRWIYDPSWGWVWIPGDEWAPAWVRWRYGGGVIGWAPLGPGWVSYSPPWIFVDSRYFLSPYLYRYRVDPRQVYSVTRPVAPPAGYRWSPGPPPQHVASVTGRPVPRAPARVAPPPPAVQGRPRVIAPPPATVTPPPTMPVPAPPAARPRPGAAQPPPSSRSEQPLTSPAPAPPPQPPAPVAPPPPAAGRSEPAPPSSRSESEERPAASPARPPPAAPSPQARPSPPPSRPVPPPPPANRGE